MTTERRVKVTYTLSGYASADRQRTTTVILISDYTTLADVVRIVATTHAVSNAEVELKRVDAGSTELGVVELEQLASHCAGLTVSVDLAVVHTSDDYGLTDAITELTDETQLLSSIINKNGSGAGWPVVRFTGNADDVVTLLARYGEPS